MSNEDYIAGDDMVALLIDQSGSEAATYAADDGSYAAVVTRSREAFEVTPPVRGAIFREEYLSSFRDLRNLEMLGLITFAHYLPGQTYVLTDTGAALAVAVH